MHVHGREVELAVIHESRQLLEHVDEPPDVALGRGGELASELGIVEAFVEQLRERVDGGFWAASSLRVVRSSKTSTAPVASSSRMG
jgi:hypothetical protein